MVRGLDVRSVFLLEVLFPVIREFLTIVVTLITPVIVGVAVNWYRKVCIDTIVRRKVMEAVLDAQEKYWHREGSERYNHAKDVAKKLIDSEGIKISEDRLESLIPSSVKLMRSGKNWFPEGK